MSGWDTPLFDEIVELVRWHLPETSQIGVLSLDTAGPFRQGNDLNYANSGRWVRKARYLLVGAFTWFKNPKNAHESDESPGEVPEEAPIIEDYEDEDERQRALEEEKKVRELEEDDYSPSILPEDVDHLPGEAVIQEEEENQHDEASSRRSGRRCST